MSNSLHTTPPPPPPSTDLPPPDYAPLQPQILITPLPDSASFFWGKTVQGEIYVKGLGEGRGDRIGIVDSLSVQLSLTNHLPSHPTLNLYQFPIQILYPPQQSVLTNESSSTLSPSVNTIPFSTAHRFSIPLPSSLSPSSSSSSSPSSTINNDSLGHQIRNDVSQSLPGTLNLTSYEKGEIKYSLSVKLTLPNGQVVIEEMKIEGTPQEVSCEDEPHSQNHEQPQNIDGQEQVTSSSSFDRQRTEVEEKLEKDGVLARLLIDQDKPRLGELLRLGVEIRPVERKKTGVIGLVKQSDPIETLRPLRRVRVELFRKVIIRPNQQQYQSNQASSSSSSTTTESIYHHNNGSSEHLTLLHASGKSLRYPGSGRKYPPLRVLFTIPTAQSGVVAEQTWGEITSSVPYHSISFFIKVTIGFGDISASKDWTLSRSITIRPKKWKEPREIVIDRGMEPNLGDDSDTSPIRAGTRRLVDGSDSDLNMMDRQGSWSEEDYRKEAYRQKGRDVVGSSGTFRFPESGNSNNGIEGSHELPPPFESNQFPSSSGSGEAGPSSRIEPEPQHDHQANNQSELPTFLESEEQARTGDAPILNETVRSERLVPVNFDQDGRSIVIPDEDDSTPPTIREGEEFDRNTWVGRRGSLGGELGTWVEYDGYETFSVAPPSMDASYGAGGSMDPPQEGDDNNVNLVGGMVARLGLDGEGAGMQGLELMEHLGLGEGTRVVDLQDDLPPGIDEPSLPALPDFNAHSHAHPHQQQIPNPQSSPPPPAHAPYISPPTHSHSLPVAHDPPSFDASQAANAVGGLATSHIRSSTTPSSTAMRGRRPSRHAIDDAVGVGNVTNQGDAPPGYERAGGEGGLPPYS